MMDPARTQPPLRDLESATLTQQQICRRHANVFEENLRVAVRRVIVAEHGEHALDRHAGRIHRDHDHRLLLVFRRCGIGLTHEDRDLASRITCARDPPLAAIERSEEHTSELQSLRHLVCRLLLEKKKKKNIKQKTMRQTHIILYK